MPEVNNSFQPLNNQKTIEITDTNFVEPDFDNGQFRYIYNETPPGVPFTSPNGTPQIGDRIVLSKSSSYINYLMTEADYNTSLIERA